MSRQVVVKVAFDRAYHKLSRSDQQLVDKALKDFERYLYSGQAPVGLGIRHLESKTYEFRVGLGLRAVYVLEEDKVMLSLLGTHDEVRDFLKRQ